MVAATLKEMVTQLMNTHYWEKNSDALTLAVVTGYRSTVLSDDTKSFIVNYQGIKNVDTAFEEEFDDSCTIFDFFENFTPVKKKKR